MCANATPHDKDYEFYSLANDLLIKISIGTSEEIEDYVQSSLARVIEIFDVDRVFLAKTDKTAQAWIYQALSREEPQKRIYKEISFSQLPWMEKLVLANKEIIINADHDWPAEANPESIFFDRLSVHGLLAEPYIAKQKSLIGCIGLEVNDRSRIWTEQNKQRLRVLGNIYAAAAEQCLVEKERIEQEKYTNLLHRFTQIAFEPVDFQESLKKMAEILAEITAADICGFGIWDAEKRRIFPAGFFGILPEEKETLYNEQEVRSLTEYLMKSGKPLVIENVAESEFLNYRLTRALPVTCILALPLSSKMNNLGSAFVSYRNPHQFTTEEITRCIQASEQITLALTKMQLLEHSQQHIAELNTVGIISRSMRNAQSLPEIPNIIMQKVVELCQVDSVAIAFWDKTKDSYSLFRTGNPWQNLSQEEFFARYGFIYEVIRKGKTIQFPAAEEVSSIVTYSTDQDFIVAFPLVSRQQSLGAFCVLSKKPFSDYETNLFSAIADLIANAVYRQSLLDNLHLQLETLRKTKMQLVQKEKLAAIGSLVAGVAHELNNPLTTIALTSEYLIQQSMSDQERYDLEKIISESRRASSIVHGLLDFSRQHAPERKILQVNEVLERTVELIKYQITANNIECVLDLDPLLPETTADPHQLRQVFINLINNAVHALRGVDLPRVLKITTSIEPSRYYGQVDNPEKYICIVFADNGAGIPPSILPKIFDPFFTTKAENEGTGLGLSVCHGIISEHDGHIWAESNSNGGARLFVEIPIRKKTDDVKTEPKFKASSGSGVSRILLVEDEVSVLEIIQRSLSNKGYLVEVAYNGIDGLQKLEEQYYDLIICDLSMPGMGGIKFYQEVKRTNAQQVERIIFTTGDTLNEGNQEFIRMTGCTLLMKPFTLDSLLNLIAARLEQFKT